MNIKGYYTGVGSRETPQNILDFMIQIGYRMAQLGYVGRSGSAGGADSAFEQGFMNYIQQYPESGIMFEGYLPWKGFSDIQPDKYHVDTPKLYNYNRAVDIASQTHPVWERLKRGAQALHTRNVYQVLGLDLKAPSNVLFCYAQPTYNKHKELTGVKGGTNTAVQLALNNNIKVYNFYFEEDIIKVKELLKM